MANRGALILNEVLPNELRKALDLTASAQNVTLNDVAGSILSDHFGLSWEYSGKSYREMAPQFKLYVPEALHLKLRMTAAIDKRTVVRGIVISVLADHFNLEDYSSARRPRSAPS
jgi:hypothetical protein